MEKSLDSNESSKRMKTNTFGVYMTSSTNDADVDFLVCPKGRDASKRKVRKGKSYKGKMAIAADPMEGGAHCQVSGRTSLSPIQKCTAAVRMLAYGVGSDVTDEYLRLVENTANEFLYKFVIDVISVFGPQYLHRFNAKDVQHLPWIGESRVPCMMDNIDFMHWEWKNCPKALHGSILYYTWSQEKLGMIMRVCIVLHNMIVENERYTYNVNFDSRLDYNDCPTDG
ncbi:hypothetical protein CRG98_022263 [Punica granatum]|uniref:Uncharacterized protein n=1 Tax=Punica granatum TaxID=22663 RepID=A0A2I0JM27_PUNGR|nr:hypothetical protein CRG98_022263 [Punica granatum]